MQIVFRMTDLENGIVVWTNRYSFKKGGAGRRHLQIGPSSPLRQTDDAKRSLEGYAMTRRMHRFVWIVLVAAFGGRRLRCHDVPLIPRGSRRTCRTSLRRHSTCSGMWLGKVSGIMS